VGVIMRKSEYPDLHRYEKEYNADGTERHILCDGARFHVTSWLMKNGEGVERCSEPNCEVNKHGSSAMAILARHKIVEGFM
jgi:hypothetical protein